VEYWIDWQRLGEIVALFQLNVCDKERKRVK